MFRDVNVACVCDSRIHTFYSYAVVIWDIYYVLYIPNFIIIIIIMSNDTLQHFVVLDLFYFI